MINIDSCLLESVDEKSLWLLMHLAKRMGANKTTWPSNKTLCADTKWTLPTLQKVKAHCIDSGLIQVTTRHNAETGQTTNEYKINTLFIQK